MSVCVKSSVIEQKPIDPLGYLLVVFLQMITNVAGLAFKY